MAVIGSIRKRGALIAVIIFIALLAFVLGDFLFKGRGLFQSEQSAGEISGTSVSLIEFDNEVQRTAEMLKERKKQVALDDETMNQIRDRVWEKYVNDIALKPQYRKAGISVSENEVKDLLLGTEPDPIVIQHFTDPNTGQVAQFMRDPRTGQLSAQAVKRYDDTLAKYKEQYPAEWNQWVEFQQALPDVKMESKYMALIKKGLYVTTAQAKTDYENLNRTVDFNYLVKPYSSISDSTVKVNEQDLLKYYNENKTKFKQDASRKFEYVIFDLKPTQADYDEVKTQLDKTEEDWGKIKNKKEDSLFVVREADQRSYDTTLYGKGKLPFQIDSLAHASEKGSILPIYVENDAYHLCKVIAHETTPDSVKARHILLKVAPKDSLGKIKAKARIDSIKSVIQKKHNFEEMAKKFSEDAGSRDSGGTLGWFTAGKMVPEFQDACFHGKKGDLPVALSQFGYHLIEILDQTTPTLKTAVATIDRKVEPGTKTRQDVFNTVNDFIEKYHTTETFSKGAEQSHLIVRVADPLKESDKTIAGLENPREVIRWAFNAKNGEVSTTPFNMGDKYVVGHLAEIREEGFATIEQRKDEIEFGAKKTKKGEMISEEFNKLNAKTLDEYAAKMNLHINSAEGATFSSYSIPKVGRESKLYGPLFTMKQNETSKPVAGESGVYVLRIAKITQAPATTDYSTAKKQAMSNYSYRADMEPIEAIKKKAEIKDNRAKFF
ncbi:MAG: peptidylprolyl isomerase [Bacteroidetes bacterium]|nr:peptidylprolyl isomerase [Bacteroidota bacterium]